MSGAYEAITVVGGVLPPALLGRIQTGTLRDVTGLKPASYFLSGRETIGDAASRSWAYLKGVWQDWQDADARNGALGAGTGDARQRWLLILLRELGYGQVPIAGSDLPGRSRFPVSHLWQSVPIHLLGPRVDLDRRNPGVEGAATAPQKMLQEFLNHQSDLLWGILSNGLKLRLLRDSTALAGSAYVEFDLETIFTSDLYPEFQLFWQLCHQSRLAGRGEVEASPASCWLEAWRLEAVESGSRALDRLGVGVQKALESLGTGLLRHPDNAWLVAALQSQELSRHDFHKALLRTAYRLLFCFVVEDRGALHTPNSSVEARRRYDEYFSTRRLRALSRKHSGGPHPDLWRAQKLVLSALGGNGLETLGLPALGGVFDPDPRAKTVAGQADQDLLLGCELSNKDLLSAVYSLSWVKNSEKRVEAVDYRHLGAEELGSVYESLLELEPRLELETKFFELENVAGNERKVTGSYYTPPNLVSALLDTALDPLLDEAVQQASDAADAERRLLALTVCDPASGSGGFLVAAARRIARRVAEVRAGEDEPRPEAIRHALHDVVDRCIYGVDMNDLAAELAKVSLWLEAMEPGKPLNFLDSRIKIGNSLLGASPRLMANGIPNEAFKAIEGDDPGIATEARKTNKESRRSWVGRKVGGAETTTFDFSARALGNQDLIAKRNALNTPVASADEARRRAQEYARFDQSDDMEQLRLSADAWCASFVWHLDGEHPVPPTNAIFQRIRDGLLDTNLTATVSEIRRLRRQYRFFHWHLEFPEIFGEPELAEEEDPNGWPGGFSCMLGNPPWDQVELSQTEFFAPRDPSIARIKNKKLRDAAIANLSDSDPLLFDEYTRALRSNAGFKAFAHDSGYFPLSSYGRLNTYSLFTELFAKLLSPGGRLGAIVPTGIATDSFNQYFFSSLVDSQKLASLYDFENSRPYFAKVHRSYKFCLLTCTGRSTEIISPRFAFFLDDPTQVNDSSFDMSSEEIRLINPNTGTLPIFRNRRDAELTKHVYRRFPVLVRDTPEDNPWGIEFRLMIMGHSADTPLFSLEELLAKGGTIGEDNVFSTASGKQYAEYWPCTESKLVHQFDSRWGTYIADEVQRVSPGDKQNPAFSSRPQYWISSDVVKRRMADWNEPWVVCWRNVARSTDSRTVISTVLGTRRATDSGLPIMKSSYGAKGAALLAGTMNSMIFDYVARQKVGGANLRQFTMKQLPFPTPEDFERLAPWDRTKSVSEWLIPRLGELICVTDEFRSFADQLNLQERIFPFDVKRRVHLRAEVDAAMLHIYGIGREESEHIVEAHQTVSQNEPDLQDDSAISSNVMSIYDALQRAIDFSSSVDTLITPPPGKGSPSHAEDAVV